MDEVCFCEYSKDSKQYNIWFLGENATTKQLILVIEHSGVIKNISSVVNPAFKFRVYYLPAELLCKFLNLSLFLHLLMDCIYTSLMLCLEE